MADSYLNTLEGLLSLGSGAVAQPVSGLGGLLALAISGDSKKSAQAVKNIQEALTYAPKTEEGQRFVEDIAGLLAPVGEAIEGAQTGAGDYVFDKTGSPLAGALTQAVVGGAPDIAGGLLGAKVLPKGKSYTMGDIGTQASKFGGKQRGVFAGPVAKTAPSEDMFRAYQMNLQDVPPRQIWDETGIRVDAAGNTSFEIPDVDARLKTEIPAGAGMSLVDYLDHPELFKAYPELEDYVVKSVPDMNARGKFNPNDKVISLRSDLSPKQSLSTLMHETQHGIQGIEDFPAGGNERVGSKLAQQVGKATQYGLKKKQGILDQMERNRQAAGYEESASLARTSRKLDEINRLEGYLKDLRNGGKLTDKRRHILNSGSTLMDVNDESRMRASIQWPKKHRPQWEKDAAYEEYIINVLQDAKSKLDPDLVRQVQESGVANPTAKYVRQIDKVNRENEPLRKSLFDLNNQIEYANEPSYGTIPPNSIRQRDNGKYSVAMLRHSDGSPILYDSPDQAIEAALDYYGGQNYWNLAGEVEARLVQDRLESGNTGNPFNEPIYREYPSDKQIYLDQDMTINPSNKFYGLLEEYWRSK
jgi:hypothetical protein